MQTMRMELPGVLLASIMLAYLPAALVQAEERDTDLRSRILRLNEITGKDPLRGEVRSLLKDKALARKFVAEAARMAGEKPQPFTYNATYALGTVATQLKDYRAGEKFYRVHLEQAKQLRSTQGILIAYGGLIASTYANRKYAETEKLCAEASQNELLLMTLQNLQGEKDKESQAELRTIKRFLSGVVEEQIMAVARQGDADRAADIIDRLLKDQSDGWLALDLKARAYRLAGKNKEALKAYEDEIQRVKDDNDLKKKDKDDLITEANYALSGVYIELGQVEKAAAKLKALLEKNPDNPTYNNDLGYVWADHDMNLAEAEKLVRKALEKDRKQRLKANPDLKPEDIKDRGAYLDSLGWVLFKQKKYAEAKKYLQQAVKQSAEDDEGESIEILDHLGDVLMALGEKSEAVAVWKKGVRIAGDTQREQKRKEEVQKKLKAHE
jgi:tetratricopeptide (TPR) repeat protein